MCIKEMLHVYKNNVHVLKKVEMCQKNPKKTCENQIKKQRKLKKNSNKKKNQRKP